MRKIIIIATAALIFLIALLFIFNSLKRVSPTSVRQSTITPTTVPFETFSREEILQAGKSLAPYETGDFRFTYSPELDKMVVTEKTDQGYQEYVNWVSDNGLTELAGNPEVVVFENSGSFGGVPISGNGSSNGVAQSKLSNTPDVAPLIDFLNIFINFSQNLPKTGSGSSPTSAPKQSELPSSSSNNQFKYTYYAQCNGYGNISLPSGCTLCQAGCGPTTVAMIASSYLGNQYTPQRIVNLYQQRGYFLGCGGSYYGDAKAALESLGLKTTSYMAYNLDTADRVASDFKKYIDSGWTIFTLANFRADGGGHYFWITEVKGNNIYAYDPYYGRLTSPPLNENDRYPFPKYRIAFGVKK